MTENKCEKCNGCNKCNKYDTCGKCNRLYMLARLFCDNVWSNITDIPHIKDYVHRIENINQEYIFSNFMLYDSEYLETNCILQLEQHKLNNSMFFVVKFYKTKCEDLEVIKDKYASKLIDKILSMKVYVDKVDILYSQNYYAPDIMSICEEVYNYIHEYMYNVKGLSEQQLDEESKKLSDM